MLATLADFLEISKALDSSLDPVYGGPPTSAGTATAASTVHRKTVQRSQINVIYFTEESTIK